METVTVNKETLQKLLDYMEKDEAKNYEECAEELTDTELANHAYSFIMELQNCINNQ